MTVQEYELPRSGIAYRPRDEVLRSPRIFVSETEFSREMLQLANGASGSRTATFPKTVREVRDCAFAENEHMASVVLNEGWRRSESTVAKKACGATGFQKCQGTTGDVPVDAKSAERVRLLRMLTAKASDI